MIAYRDHVPICALADGVRPIDFVDPNFFANVMGCSENEFG